jgi:competence ComEA-like helix-hairpin-helix protein
MSIKLLTELLKIFYFGSYEMKKFFKSYATFNRTERIGLLSLCGVLLILFAIRASMPLWVHERSSAEKDKRLVAAWAAFKGSQTSLNTDTLKKQAAKEDPIVHVDYEYQDRLYKEHKLPQRNIVDANTVDSAGLAQINGIDATTASLIIAYRNNKGRFTNINQLGEILGVSKASFRILKERLVIAP